MKSQKSRGTAFNWADKLQIEMYSYIIFFVYCELINSQNLQIKYVRLRFDYLHSSVMCFPHFKTVSKPLVPSCGRCWWWFTPSQPLSPLVPYFNWPGFVHLLCCNEKARGASRLKILSASPCSNSPTPKLGPLYKIYCLKLSRNKNFKRPGCFNASRWIIKKYAFPDNGEENVNTFGCKPIEETHRHIFVWGLYMSLSCILISVCKETVKYSYSISHWLCGYV